ncbi:hypothetical protein SUGI_0682660 [Cryptomeria japonica]|nr:hypothetical protein SUGI_0682660 [Cryptomeria japonica]
MKGVNQRVARTVSAFLACIIVVGVVCTLLLMNNFRLPSLRFSTMQTLFHSEMDDYATDPDIPPYNSSDVTDELKVSLSKAANQEKTVLITTLNAAWAQKNSMVDLFLKSFHIEGVDFSGEKLYMTRGYLKMMWRRIRFFGQVLERRYNFVFSDADIMWFRDPSTKFSSEADC